VACCNAVQLGVLVTRSPSTLRLPVTWCEHHDLYLWYERYGAYCEHFSLFLLFAFCPALLAAALSMHGSDIRHVILLNKAQPPFTTAPHHGLAHILSSSHSTLLSRHISISINIIRPGMTLLSTTAHHTCSTILCI